MWRVDAGELVGSENPCCAVASNVVARFSSPSHSLRLRLAIHFDIGAAVKSPGKHLTPSSISLRRQKLSLSLVDGQRLSRWKFVGQSPRWWNRHADVATFHDHSPLFPTLS